MPIAACYKVIGSVTLHIQSCMVTPLGHTFSSRILVHKGHFIVIRNRDRGPISEFHRHSLMQTNVINIFLTI